MLFYVKLCLFMAFHAIFLSNILLTLALDNHNWVKHMYNWKRYFAAGIVIGTVYFLPSESFIAFLTGWVILLPIAAAVFLAAGLRGYIKDSKNRITISVKANDAMKALARREAELKREKELLYEQFGKV
ncbi:hypothetical protein FLAV_02601 [Flavobacteriales bacterium]|nr:hypothetical protein FLAV_02601 [Flavobacteriales bacterium]